EDEPQRTPTFDEVRDKVAAAWKRIEAAKLAEKTAKDLAAESEKSTQSFDDFFKEKDYEVVPQTALFSWLEYPGGLGTGASLQQSDIPELKYVGPDFMEGAFSLDGNKTMAMLNVDHSAAYVVRLNSRQYTPERLKELFLEEDNKWLGRRDMLQM